MNAFSTLFRRKTAENTLPHLHTSAPNFTPPVTQLKRGPVQLDIVMGSRCPICAASRPLVEQLERDLPGVNIRVIDIDAPGVQVPRNIVAIPTFIVNGYVVATGNPAIEEL